ncbi:nagb/rpia/CoA transferase-like protein [Jaminaea rosea]|uniref:5-formyltetrahydrofolate cyclo-ligase n=1 Tax=Jaminaea rosea TaxID=1569628 RepID=A0A316UNC9_9BASI|nr:nagb/rpia/CoA transferase-like protein [Jaminaea rosea]PWN25861.1 nagb/rpia/CoA transferase-like protein [Jaminaea rosea]
MASTAAAAGAASSIRTAKRTLRKSMATRLSSIDPQDLRAQSHKVTSRILASSTYRSARNISIYVSTDTGEVETDELCRCTLADETKRLYVPLFATPAPTALGEQGKVGFAPDMRMLQLRSLAEYEGMKRNRWGIREPEDWVVDDPETHGAVESDVSHRRPRPDALDAASGGEGLDLILAPGVAFDVFAGRLGHGKGYYDRYLSQAEAWAAKRGKQGPVCVALGLREQVLPEGERVPADERDRVLDGIVTPDGVLRGHEDRGKWQGS